MKKRLTVAVVLLLIGTMVIGCGAKTVATVNGEKVTQPQLDKIINLYVAQAKQVYGTDPKQDQEMMKEIKKAALNDLIDQTLLIQKATSQGLKATDKEVSDAIKNFKESSGAEGYKNFLKASGMTDEDFKQEMYNQVLVGEIHDKSIANVKVSAKEVQTYYEQHPEDFGNLRELKVSHILLKTKKEAQTVIQKLKTGEDFGTLAQELSTEPAAKESKGDLGFINEQSNLVTEFKNAALKLKPGEITEEPVESQFGFHVIKAFEEKAAHVDAFEKVQDQAKELAQKAKEEKTWTDFVTSLRKEGKIKTNV
jgi:peptidyl-prolyl cis-trans isomerase C/foldase protein PrsA